MNSAAKRRKSGRAAFSLLEVILALAILTMAVAVLGELARLGMENARVARDKTQAELLCESKLAEIAAGITVPEPVQGVPFEGVTDPSEPAWLYSIALETIDQQGLIAVRVTVAQDLPPQKRPVAFSLVRWIQDPNVELPDETMEETGTGTTTKTGASQ